MLLTSFNLVHAQFGLVSGFLVGKREVVWWTARSSKTSPQLLVKTRRPYLWSSVIFLSDIGVEIGLLNAAGTTILQHTAAEGYQEIVQ